MVFRALSTLDRSSILCKALYWPQKELGDIPGRLAAHAQPGALMPSPRPPGGHKDGLREQGLAKWSPQHLGPGSGEPHKAASPWDVASASPNSQASWPDTQRLFLLPSPFASWSL